jgi:hypothetical protein
MSEDQQENSRSEKSLGWVGLQPVPEIARISLAQKRADELVARIQRQKKAISDLYARWTTCAPPENARDHAAHMNRLEVETEEPVSEIDRLWSAVRDLSERDESAGRMAFLESLDHALAWRSEFLSARAFARQELGERLDDEEQNAFQVRDNPQYRERLRVHWKEREVSLQQVAAASDPPSEIVAQRARVAFEAQQPGRGKKLVQGDWIDALHAWSRRKGAPKKGGRSAGAATPKWTALARLLRKAGFQPIQGKALGNAWLDWRKMCLSKAGIFTIQR